MTGSRDQNRVQPVDPDHATGAIRRLLAEIRTKFALVPNLFRVLANAPAALEGLMGLSAALARGALDEKTREQLALAIAESNLCAYCLSGHTAMAAKIGLSRVEIDDAIRASASDARTDAILKLARSIVVQRGELTDAVRRVSQLADQRSHAVKLAVSKDGIEISASSPEYGEAKENIDKEYKGDPIAIGFNSTYMLDFLSAAADGPVSIELKDDLSAGQMRPLADESYRYRYIIMPMRI